MGRLLPHPVVVPPEQVPRETIGESLQNHPALSIGIQQSRRVCVLQTEYRLLGLWDPSGERGFDRLRRLGPRVGCDVGTEATGHSSRFRVNTTGVGSVIESLTMNQRIRSGQQPTSTRFGGCRA